MLILPQHVIELAVVAWKKAHVLLYLLYLLKPCVTLVVPESPTLGLAQPGNISDVLLLEAMYTAGLVRLAKVAKHTFIAGKTVGSSTGMSVSDFERGEDRTCWY